MTAQLMMRDPIVLAVVSVGWVIFAVCSWWYFGWRDRRRWRR